MTPIRHFFVFFLILGTSIPQESLASSENKDTALFMKHLNHYSKVGSRKQASLLRKILALYDLGSAAPNKKAIETWFVFLKQGILSYNKKLQLQSYKSFNKSLEKLDFYNHSVNHKALQKLVLKLFPWKKLSKLCRRYSSQDIPNACFNLTWLRYRNHKQGIQAFEKMMKARAADQQSALSFISTHKLEPLIKKQKPLAQLLLLYANRLIGERQISAILLLQRLDKRFNWIKLAFYQHSLTSPNPRNKRIAMQALFSLGQSARPAAMVLHNLLKDKNKGVRRSALRVLGWIDLPKQVQQQWFSPMLQDKNKRVQTEALKILHDNKVLPSKENIPLLITQSFGDSRRKRERANSFLHLYGQDISPFLPSLLEQMNKHPKYYPPTMLLRILQKAGTSKALIPSLEWLLENGKGSSMLGKTIAIIKKMKKKAASLVPALNKKLQLDDLKTAELVNEALEAIQKGNAKTVSLLKQKIVNKRYQSIHQDLASTLLVASSSLQRPANIVWLLKNEYYANLKGMDKLFFQIMVIPIMLDLLKEKIPHRQWYQGTHPEKFKKLKPSIVRANKQFVKSCDEPCRLHIQRYGKQVSKLYENEMANVLQIILKSKAAKDVRYNAMQMALTMLGHFAIQRKYHRDDLNLKPPHMLCIKLAQAAQDKQPKIRKPAKEIFRKQCLSDHSDLKSALEYFSPNHAFPPTSRSASHPASRSASRPASRPTLQ